MLGAINKGKSIIGGKDEPLLTCIFLSRMKNYKKLNVPSLRIFFLIPLLYTQCLFIMAWERCGCLVSRIISHVLQQTTEPSSANGETYSLLHVRVHSFVDTHTIAFIQYSLQCLLGQWSKTKEPRQL